jgi:PAS domain S-box-containing protein
VTGPDDTAPPPDAGDFYQRYAEALTSYLEAGDESSLAVGHELGRRALAERMSMLAIIETHSRLVDARKPAAPTEAAAALQFLLQTLAALDVATRGFLDGTQRYEQERARADDLADRDEFRSALVNSLQEGFFVADHTGAVIEINDAFTDITGYGPDGLPFRMPHPWVTDQPAATERLTALVQEGSVATETVIRHRDGRYRWVAISINSVAARASDRKLYVGTIRDITASRAAMERDRAVARLATAVSVAKDVDEVLSITLVECRPTLDAQRLMAVMWSQDGSDPTVSVAGTPAVSSWSDLDPDWRRTFEDARNWLPLTVTPVGGAPSAGTTRGFVAVLSGARDVVLCLEHAVPRVVSAEDRRLIAALMGHLSLAMQHVRQFETARETSLTLQRSMLSHTALPEGFAVRYEPAVPPLEIGGDFYEVLPIGEHRIGIFVGDCVGRGLSAAAVMGQLRASARALLLTDAEPARLLEQLDAVAELIPDAFCTTVFVAIIDTVAETVHYSSAGHVPPVLAYVDGTAPELLTDARSVPLAVHRDEPRPQTSRPLAPGSTLMLYTDGLVERRDEPIDERINQVAAVLADAATLSVESVADTVLRGLAPESGFDDDVALVLYRHALAALVIEIDALPERLKDVRHRLTDWLHANGVPEDMAGDIVLVVNEACSNCAEHAYRGRAAELMRVDAHVADGHLHIRVTDSGSWKTPPADPGTRGRGLPLIRAVSEDVELDGTATGTAISMTFRLPDGSE